jgi:hypothetical protein
MCRLVIASSLNTSIPKKFTLTTAQFRVYAGDVAHRFGQPKQYSFHIAFLTLLSGNKHKSNAKIMGTYSSSTFHSYVIARLAM